MNVRAGLGHQMTMALSFLLSLTAYLLWTGVEGKLLKSIFDFPVDILLQSATTTSLAPVAAGRVRYLIASDYCQLTSVRSWTILIFACFALASMSVLAKATKSKWLGNNIK